MVQIYAYFECALELVLYDHDHINDHRYNVEYWRHAYRTRHRSNQCDARAIRCKIEELRDNPAS